MPASCPPSSPSCCCTCRPRVRPSPAPTSHLTLLSAGAKVSTNANPATGGIELPLYTKNVVLSCNNSEGSNVDHWQFNGHELQADGLAAMGIRKEGNSLVIENARKHHEGNYTCAFGASDVEGVIMVKGES